jgi:hypothetical protein
VANICPINGDNHRYFVHSTKVEFEPSKTNNQNFTAKGEGLKDEVLVKMFDYLNTRQLYERIEYAMLGCNCGSVIKSKVKDFQYGEE